MNKLIKLLITILFLFGVALFVLYNSAFPIFGNDRLTPEFEDAENFEIVFYDYSEQKIRFLNIDRSLSLPYEIELIDPFTKRRTGVSWGNPLFTWSPDGKYLAFLLKPFSPSGYPVLLSMNGEFIKCDSSDVPVTQNRIWVTENLKVISPDSSRLLEQVVIYDFEACKVDEIIYIAENENIGILEATISSEGWLAIHQWVRDSGAEILIVDPDGKEYNIPGGQNPSWSKNGIYLTFIIDGEGIFYSKKDGSNIIEIENKRNWIGGIFPSWSPDSEWIVYSESDHIYKINIKSFEKILMIKNGSFPNWRWEIP